MSFRYYQQIFVYVYPIKFYIIHWFPADFQRKQLTLAPDDEGGSRYSKELEGLQKILHFPEEVAILLTEVESGLFHDVPPADYIRQVTIGLGRPGGGNSKASRVEDLIHRFNEVSGVYKLANQSMACIDVKTQPTVNSLFRLDCQGEIIFMLYKRSTITKLCK